MIILAISLATVVCSLQAVRAARLMSAALWLAAASAGVSLLLFTLGARQAAVIELSVGAGLVLILFVLAINVAGQPQASPAARVPRPLAWCLAGLCALLLAELVWPALAPVAPAEAGAPLTTVLWSARSLDVIVLVALIFMGAVTVVGLLAPAAVQAPPPPPARQAQMERLSAGASPLSQPPEAAYSAQERLLRLHRREVQPWR